MSNCYKSFKMHTLTNLLSLQIHFESVQLLSCVWLFATPWTAARQVCLSIINSRSLLKLKSIESVMPSKHLILCRPLLLPPSIFPSIAVFSNESVLRIKWPKYWSFSFSICSSNEYSGLISFRIDWLDLLAVQGTLQHHSSKASILWHSAFFLVQLKHPYMITGKTTALTAAAAKSLQSCPTLCDPIDGSPPGSSVPGILQARTLEWVAISFPRGIFQTQGSNPGLPFLKADALTSEPPGKPLIKAMVFPVVMYGCESWTIKKAECRRIDAFELWCWRRLLRVPWTARRSNQSILKAISPEYSLEGLMLKLKCQSFGHQMRRTDSLEKTLMLGNVQGGRRNGQQRMR